MSGASEAVRLLFSFVGGEGHFAPLVPLARAAVEAGHAVAFAAPAAMAARVEATGFRALPVGSRRARPPERIPLRAVDREREERDLRERFVERAARERVPLLIELFREFRAQVVVCDETDFGAMIAAERLGLPFASAVVIAAGSFVRPDVVAEALDELRAEHGLPADPKLEAWRRHLVLAPFPDLFRDPGDPLPATARGFRPGAGSRARGTERPEWARTIPGAPVLYFTLGTVFPVESGDLFARVLAGLAEQRLNALVTVGPEVDPAEYRPQPRHVRIERYVPQAEILPHCDAVICHGGSGTVLAALARGLPLVLIPLGADQPQNAERCRALGVAECLDAVSLDSQALSSALSAVLEQPAYRARAEAIAEETSRLPGVREAASWIAALATEGRP